MKKFILFHVLLLTLAFIDFEFLAVVGEGADFIMIQAYHHVVALVNDLD